MNQGKILRRKRQSRKSSMIDIAILQQLAPEPRLGCRVETSKVYF